MKKLLCCLLITFVGLNVSFSQNPNSKTPQIDETFANFMKLPQQQLYDTAVYYHKNNILDTALICYNLIINASESSDSLQMLLTAQSLSMAGVIYLNHSDFRNAYKYITDALILAEKYNFESELQIIYNNLGNIYFHFGEYDLAKTYFLKALNFTDDKNKYFGVLNNIACVERENGNMDSAFIYFDKSVQFSKEIESIYLPTILSEMALFYKKTNQIDSALYYLRYSVNEAKKRNHIQSFIEGYSEIGKIFFEMNQFDSAIYYLNFSNLTVSTEKQFINIMSDNYLTLSKIEELKGNIRNAFKYYKKYSSLKDSIYNNNILGDINQIQRQYEVSKTNRQIEQFVIEQQIKERTIHYQKIILIIIVITLILVSGGLVFMYLQNTKLNNSYKVLVEKNIELINLQDISTKEETKNIKTKKTSENIDYDLLERIFTIMDNPQTFCNPDFYLDDLVELTHSNQKYVSNTINDALNKNFRTFLNSYRIKQAQRIFAEPDVEKYTIESVGQQVGFNSRASFISAFNEITGVTPKIYLKEMHKEKVAIKEIQNEEKN